MKHALALLSVAVFLHTAVACKRKPASAPVAPAATETAANAPAPSTASTATSEPSVSVPTAATGIAQAKPGASESSPLNGELTDAVARFRDKHKRLPASWQELVQTGFLKSLPTPPPGVRYAIDPVSAMVVEVK